MTALTLDGRTVQVDGETMRDLLQQAQRSLAMGRVLTRVVVDGSEIPGFAEDAFLSSSARLVQRIEVETQEAAGLLIKGLDLERNFLSELSRALPSIALVLRRAELEPARGSLLAVAEGFKSLVQVLQGINVFHPAMYRDFRHEEKSIEDHLRDLAKVLESVNQAQSNADWVLLADVMEYEMPGAADRWVALLTKLATALRGGDSV